MGRTQEGQRREHEYKRTTNGQKVDRIVDADETFEVSTKAVSLGETGDRQQGLTSGAR